MTILITGATGFVGRALIKSLIKKSKHSIKASVRSCKHNLPSTVKVFESGDIGFDVDWSSALQDVSTIVHVAGRAHILNEKHKDPLDEFRRVNVAGTVKLAKQASIHGVKRFIYISSIGVNGNQTKESSFTEKHRPDPVEPYAISKFEAEIELKNIARAGGMEYVIIRPGLIYGINAPGNFKKLLDLINGKFPIPLGAIKNLRSLIYIDNLVDFIIHCIDHPRARNEVFLICDGEDISTPDLIKVLSIAMAKKTYLIPVPAFLLRIILKVLGKEKMYVQLCGSLQIDTAKAKDLLGWEPKLDVKSGLKYTAELYKKGYGAS